MTPASLSKTVTTDWNNGGNHNGNVHDARTFARKFKCLPRPIFPATLLTREVNVSETLELARAILDKDSPHGGKEAAEGEAKLKGKLKKLQDRYDRAIKSGGEETRTSAALKRQLGFLESVQAILGNHIGQLEAGQAGFKARFDGVVAKWDHKKKIYDFADSVIAKYCVPGLAVLAPAATMISKRWDSLRGVLDSALTPQKKWIMGIVDVAAYALGAVADLGGTYLGRKWLINWAANRKGEMDVEQQVEFNQVEKERQAMLEVRYAPLQREILALLAQNGHAAN